MSVAVTQPFSLGSRWRVSAWPERLVLGSAIVATLAASLYLLPFWRESAELSHGYFAPLCALALLWQSRSEPDLMQRWTPSGAFGLQVVLTAGGLLGATIAALAALVQGPFHSQPAFLSGMVMGLLTLSGVVVLSRAPSGWVRLNGASLCAALLWCFVVPLPSGTLARFTLFLQDLITAGSLHAVHLFGFPATRDGNIIRLPNTLVGVEEACSGIRSLTACLFAGVVLGGLMLQGLPRRIAIVIGAGAIAIVSNFIRSVSLCLMAAHGIEIKGFWHDATAYAVLGATAAVLFVGCLLLAPKKTDITAETPLHALRRSALAAHGLLAGTIAVLVTLVVLKTAPVADRPPPDLQTLTVIETADWKRRTDESIFAFSTALNTSYLRQESYFRGDTQLTFYVAFWPSRQSTLGSVALHTPEICLPGSGWITLPLPAAEGGYPLPSPRRFAFEKHEYPQHVWFWHYFDGRPVVETAGLYPWQLGPLLLKGSVSARAPQWVLRVSSNKPLESLQNEPIFREFFARVRAAGLAGAPPAT